MNNLRTLATKTLRGNDRGGYTVPSPNLYPFQWLWDAGFIALGWATFDEKRAWLELQTLLKAQWDDGMVPHIVFHQQNPSYFPGPEFWAAPGPVPSTGITQPPVLATVIRCLLEGARDRKLAEALAQELYPKLLAYHRWFYRTRDPEGTGLVAILHPWESGLDNSPLWDEALARSPRVALTTTRRDTGHVSVEQRPTTEEYEHYMGLIQLFREHNYDANSLYHESPFKIASVSFNSVLHRANRDLLALAQTLDQPPAEQREIAAWLESGAKALAALWSEEDGFFYSHDLLSDQAIRLHSFEGFMPLYAGIASKDQAARLAETLRSWGERLRYLVPSTDPNEPTFEPQRYWRGPVWIHVNWMLAQGLAAYGLTELAARVKEDSLKLIRRSGLHEYFDPHTGEGLGGNSFAWTAALYLYWLDHKS